MSTPSYRKFITTGILFQDELDEDRIFQRVIQAALEDFCFTDMELARVLKVSRPTVTRWKNGKTSPAPRMRPAILDALMKEARRKEKIAWGWDVGAEVINPIWGKKIILSEGEFTRLLGLAKNPPKPTQALVDLFKVDATRALDALAMREGEDPSAWAKRLSKDICTETHRTKVERLTRADVQRIYALLRRACEGESIEDAPENDLALLYASGLLLRTEMLLMTPPRVTDSGRLLIEDMKGDEDNEALSEFAYRLSLTPANMESMRTVARGCPEPESLLRALEQEKKEPPSGTKG